jgi:hypothetical protein
LKAYKAKGQLRKLGRSVPAMAAAGATIKYDQIEGAGKNICKIM